MPIIHLDQPPNFCVTIVLSIYWVLQSSQEKMDNQNAHSFAKFWKVNKMYYGQFEHNEWSCNHFIMFPQNNLIIIANIHQFTDLSRVPNENIVQNHLNIAQLNIFQYLNGGYGHIFSMSNDPEILGIKTYLFENFSQKKGSRKSQLTFLG